MSRYRIEYSGLAAASRKALPPDYRARFEKEMARTLGTGPYGHGSDPAGNPQEPDRPTATIAGAVVPLLRHRRPRPDRHRSPHPPPALIRTSGNPAHP
uniref:hypothetical protein n=4 Tax=Streptomyces clavuligerus TaxID=1901 RepID=UPI001E5BB150